MIEMGIFFLGVKKGGGVKVERVGGSKERKWEGLGRCKEEGDVFGRSKLRG